ncbi:uncharacterized protein B0H64DRAFT_128108 [Chaetomium fimeti]|uniref:Uncharacterized protein n=1 Tax=Chaetomium fimeti TaxID=1854472 RepID=A0AAE0HJA9_9PEZI|nr:hypothetical protein B0H64DRAFT_128108 [Chaetomium fimeti]
MRRPPYAFEGGQLQHGRGVSSVARWLLCALGAGVGSAFMIRLYRLMTLLPDDSDLDNAPRGGLVETKPRRENRSVQYGCAHGYSTRGDAVPTRRMTGCC